MSSSTDDKNFRLSRTVRPSRYAPTLTLDPDAGGFAGEQTVELTLQAPTREVILHALELSVEEASFCVPGGPWLPATVEEKKASETVVLRFAQELPVGEGTLQLRWKGQFCPGLRGLYRAGSVLATQFEAADARRVFPCFDEPSFKARWALTVRLPPGLTALSNGEPLSDLPDGPLRKLVFRETEVLSSYLVALVVGPLEADEAQHIEGVPVRTWAVPEKKALTRFGQQVALAVLPRLREYFGLPYAFGKVDQVGLPEFEAGAMENAGLITYREVALLLDPDTAPLSVQKRVAEVVTHELAHQWFGNWVTMEWWDDLWLNEAFATWMAYKIVAGWRPEWRVWLDFDAGKASALHLDALRSTHPIRSVVHNATEAGESFDLITYEKGGAVLRMLEGYLGEDAFREGIRRYMKAHARANAVADDLWGALAAASSQPVVELANAWIGQSGFPLLTLTRQGRQVILTQERFYADGQSHSDELWPVPVVLKYADAQGVHSQRVLLREKTATVTLEGQGEVEFVWGNAGSTGFYRLCYQKPELALLTAHSAKLEPSERISLLADQWALVKAGKASAEDFLALAQGFGAEEDYAVLDELVGKLAYAEERLVEGESRMALQAWVRTLLGAQLAQLGWEAAADESSPVRLRRAAVLKAVGLVGRDVGVSDQARLRVERLLAKDKTAVEPNLLDAAVAMAARRGDGALFDKLLARFKEETDPASKRRFLLSLAAFEDVGLAARARGLLFDGTVPMQDAASFVSGLLANRTGRGTFWEELQRRWPEVLDRTGRSPMLLRRVVESLGHLLDARGLSQATALLSAQPVEEAKMATAQTLERLRQDVALREKAMPGVTRWLAGHG